MRAFVIALLEHGDNNATRAARSAGFKGNDKAMGVNGCRLMHDDRIIGALQEEAQKRLHSGAVMAVSVLLNLAKNAPKDSDKLKAVDMILNRIGMAEKTVHQHDVNVRNDSQTDGAMLARIVHLSKTLGIDHTKLIGHTAPVETVDVEYAEVGEDLSDL
jgi:phage terminase small subunit